MQNGRAGDHPDFTIHEQVIKEKKTTTTILNGEAPHTLELELPWRLSDCSPTSLTWIVGLD